MKQNRLNLKEVYESEVRSKLMDEFGIKNKMATPYVSKIVVNMGTGELLKNKEVMDKLVKDVSLMCGQKPHVRRARISVAGFGIREGNPVGLSVTLRRQKMYDFLARLITIVLPRLRDFKGLSKGSFDGDGNYTIGLEEYSVFPEIGIGRTDKMQGIEITLVVKNSDKEKSERMLSLMGMPFEKE